MARSTRPRGNVSYAEEAVPGGQPLEDDEFVDAEGGGLDSVLDGVLDGVSELDGEVDMDMDLDDEPAARRTRVVAVAPKRKTAVPRSRPTTATPVRLWVRTQDSIEGRAEARFGTDSGLMARLAAMSRAWERLLFVVDADTLAATVPDEPAVYQGLFPDTRFSPLLEEEYAATGLNAGLAYAVDSEQGSSAPPLLSRAVHGDRTAFTLTTGGTVVDTLWLPSSGPSRILAVLVVPSTPASDPRLLVLQTCLFPSAIQLWEVLQTAPPRVVRVYCGDHGAMRLMRWIAFSASSLHGALVFVGSDGGAHAIRVAPSVASPYLAIVAPSRSWTLATNITCLDVALDACRLMVGTRAGEVAEFALDGTLHYSVPFGRECVCSVAYAEVGTRHPVEVVCVLCVDGVAGVVDMRDWRGSVTHVPHIRPGGGTSVWCRCLQMFAVADRSSAVRVFPARMVDQLVPVTTHDGSATAVAALAVHPLVLLGGADGCVKVANAARRVFAARRTKPNGFPVAVAWTLEHDEQHAQFRLLSQARLEVAAPAASGPTYTAIFDHGVSVTSVAWDDSAWMACGYACGLVVVEFLL